MSAAAHRIAMVLPDRPCLTGQVLDPSGDALGNWRIKVTCLETDTDELPAYAVTNAAGHFEVTDLASNSVRVDVIPALGRESVLTKTSVPTDKPLMMRVPSIAFPKGSVRGRIVDASGQAMADVMVELQTSNQHVAVATISTTPSGTFTFAGLLPGDYQLVIQTSTPRSRRTLSFKITNNEPFDAGNLMLWPPATLNIELVRSDGSAWRGMRPGMCVNHRDGTSSLLQIDPAPNGYDAIIEPGESRLSVTERDLVATPITLQIASAEHQTVRLVVTNTRQRSLVFAGDKDAKIDANDHLHATITAADGTEDKHQVRRSPHGDGDWTLEHHFAFGSFTVRATTDSGRRYAGSFEVRDVFTDPRRFEVPLQN